MCLFSLQVLDVADTCIFARRGKGGTQHLAYQMALRAEQDLAMVLPLPVPPQDEHAVEFVSLEDCPDFFKHFSYRLTVWEDEFGDLGTLGGLDDDVATEAKLQVHTVGRYEASFVPSARDFGRLDERFRLSQDVLGALGEYLDWGFAVFKLRELPRDRTLPMHAMALRFRTRFPDSLFFPTIHAHDGAVHPSAHFDHLLYFQAEVDAARGELWFSDGEPCQPPRTASYGKPHKNDKRGRIRWAAASGTHTPFAADVECTKGFLDSSLPMHALGMGGLLPNRDTWLHLEAPWR